MMLNMIAQEEASHTDKVKTALMAEATATVTDKFSTDKALKKARGLADKMNHFGVGARDENKVEDVSSLSVED